MDNLRCILFEPYREGYGPTFTLTMWNTGRTDHRGCTTIAYRLTMREPGQASSVIFEGEDFHGSPLHADDSDRTVAALMGFLTLRPGDTDREYFQTYTPEQIAFTQSHAEALDADVYDRFGDRW